jgi:hypothetical protein
MHTTPNWAVVLFLMLGGCGEKAENARPGPNSAHADSSIPVSDAGNVDAHEPDAGTTTIPSSKEEFAQRAAEIVCANFQACCGDSSALVPSGCREKALADAADVVADPLIQYDPSAAADCLATIESETRGCRLATLSFEVQWEPCNRAFVGTVARGGACTDTRQCALVDNGSVTCAADFDANANSNDMICLHYLAATRGTRGQACDCSMSNGKGCEQIWNATAPLDDRAACDAQDGLYCDIKNAICKSIGDLGQQCQLNYDSCRNGLFCGDDETCQSDPQEGDSCVQQMAICGANLRCKNGRCAQFPALGEQCDFLLDHRCATGSHCSAVSDTCVAPEPLGSPCWSDSDCISGHCNIGFDAGFAGNCIANPFSDELCAEISGG